MHHTDFILSDISRLSADEHQSTRDDYRNPEDLVA